MYSICVYIPEEALDKVKQAMFDAGAGKIGSYKYCAWQVCGEGQYQPTEGSAPYTGVQGELSVVKEYRVEMVCKDACIRDVVDALVSTHPYETPAYHYWKVNQ